MLPKLALHQFGDVYLATNGADFEASALLVDAIWDASFAHLAPSGFAAAIPARDVLAFCDKSSSDGIEKLKGVAKVGEGEIIHSCQPSFRDTVRPRFHCGLDKVTAKLVTITGPAPCHVHSLRHGRTRCFLRTAPCRILTSQNASATPRLGWRRCATLVSFRPRRSTLPSSREARSVVKLARGCNRWCNDSSKAAQTKSRK